MKNHSIPNWFQPHIKVNHKMVNLHLARILFCCAIISVFFISTHAEAQTAQTVEAFLTEEEDSEILKKLLYEHVPTIFIQNGEVLVLDEGYPQKLICEVNSLSILEIENPGFRTVKLLQIELQTSDQKSRIELSPEILKFFPNLSKILISSMVPLTTQEVSQMVNGYQEGDIILLYQIQTDF